MGCSGSKPVAPAELLEGIACDPRIGEVTAEEAINVLKVGYCGTASCPKEDVTSWILGPRFASVDAEERQAFFRYYAQFFHTSCRKKGAVLGLRDPNTKEVLGVLLIRRTPETDGEIMRTMMACGTPPHVNTKVHGKGPAKRDEAAMKAMKSLNHRGPQWILYAIAVHPDCQGKKVASALVKCLFALGDRDGCPVTVECAGERMDTIYSHLGFVKVESKEVEDPTGQEGSEKLLMNSMIRRPGGNAS